MVSAKSSIIAQPTVSWPETLEFGPTIARVSGAPLEIIAVALHFFASVPSFLHEYAKQGEFVPASLQLS